MTEISRRGVVATGAAGVALAAANGALAQGKAQLTAGEVVDRIKAHVGIPWREKTVDHFIFGDPSTPVRGIATTMMATFDAFKAALAAGCNMVVTHEPTFWSHPDDLAPFKDNALYKAKTDYLQAHNAVSFHFHDHWHGLKPRDGIAVGMMRQVGWEPYVAADNPRRFTLPPTSLLAVSKHLQTRLNDRTIRVVGDPALEVTKVVASWGFVSEFPGVPLLDSDADVLICGETREWELVEYAQDLVASGKKKALIMLGHVLSEQWGMKYCAEWLGGFVTEVPVKFIPIIEPTWTPDRPVFEINTHLA
jgi:putative NIF3 family GTP cyclohydrolase 1 type 2